MTYNGCVFTTTSIYYTTMLINALMFVCLSKATLCPEMHVIRYMLNFEKYHKMSV